MTQQICTDLWRKPNPFLLGVSPAPLPAWSNSVGLLYACLALLCQLTLVASCQQHNWRTADQFCSHSRRDQFLPRHHGILPRPAALTRLGPLTSLAERGPSTVTGTSSSSLSSLTSLTSVSTGCKGVSSKCFGENYIYIICQSVKYYICQNQH